MTRDENDKGIPIQTSGGIRYVNKNDIIRFPEGLLGFRDAKEYAFFDINDCEPFKSMLSVKENGPDFVVVETRTIIGDYSPLDSLSSFEQVDLGSPMELVVLSIVTLSEKPEDITINLRAPLLVNLATSQGKQVILDDERYQTRHNIYATV